MSSIMEDTFQLLPTSEQIEVICNGLAPLRPQAQRIQSLAEKEMLSFPSGTCGIATLPNPGMNGLWGLDLNLAAAIEIWGNRSGWKLDVSEIPELTSFVFDAEKFRLNSQTKSALNALKDQQKAPVLIIPALGGVIETFSLDEIPPLTSNQFEFDLASTLWLMATHAEYFVTGACFQHIEIACLGSRYGENDEIPIVGFSRQTRRVILRSSGASFHGCVRIIGAL